MIYCTLPFWGETIEVVTFSRNLQFCSYYVTETTVSTFIKEGEIYLFDV